MTTHEKSATPLTTVTGVLLAGGLSRRMGGGDKCLADLAGKPMLAHVIARIAPQTGALVINANGDPARFAQFDLPVTPDPIEGFAGPLAGVLAGLYWSRDYAPGVSHIATVSTDAPFIPHDLVVRLSAAIANKTDVNPATTIAMASSSDNLQPVIGLWPVALADDLRQQLNDGVRKVLHWTDRHDCVTVDFEMVTVGDQCVDPFFNANRPEELEQARGLLEQVRGVG